MIAAFGLGLQLKPSYNEYYSKLNVWRQKGRALYHPGAVNLDQEQCPRDVFERSEFYNDFLRPAGVAHSMGAVICRRQSQVPTLTALRGGLKGEFGDAERRVAQYVLPHLNRAWTVYEKLGLLTAGQSVLDNLSPGVVFLGAGRVVLYSNRYAEEIFRSDDGCSLRSGVLCAWDRNADAQLHKAVYHALSPDRPPGSAAVGVPRPSGRHAYQLVIAPLPFRLPEFRGTPAPLAVVFITDPERPGPPKLDLLIQLYGLTRKEAEIAVSLSEAKSIEQSAGQLGITYQTARTHLRHIFSKTGTSRQTELLLLLARLPGRHAGE
jgi:DNA-binding CsgD family transcriptional regulator